MNLEAALAENTAALIEHSGLLKQVIAGQAKSLETIQTIEGAKISGRPRGAAKEKPAVDAPKADAPKTEAIKADAPKTEAPKADAAATPPVAAKTLTEEQILAIRKLIADFCGGTKEKPINDTEERKKRLSLVSTVFSNNGIKKAGEIEPADYTKIYGEVEAAIAEYTTESGSDEVTSLLD